MLRVRHARRAHGAVELRQAVQVRCKVRGGAAIYAIGRKARHEAVRNCRQVPLKWRLLSHRRKDIGRTPLKLCDRRSQPAPQHPRIAAWTGQLAGQ